MKRHIFAIIVSLLAISSSAQIPQAMLSAAKRGNAKAQCEVGKKYYDAGKFNDAVYWFKKSAEQNDPEAQYNLGFCFEKGYGVDNDILEAVFYYRSAAELDLSVAQYMLAGCYKDGMGVQKNPDLARKWYRAAAAQSYPAACFEYAVNYCEKYSDDYRKLLKVAIKNGDSKIKAKAYFPLALYYLEGPKLDDVIGLSYLRNADKAGDPEATFYLATLYREGKFVPQDKEQAFKLYCKASDHGIVDATFAKAECYENGEGTEANSKMALEIYESIAEQNSSAKEKAEELRKADIKCTVTGNIQVTVTRKVWVRTH